MTETEKIFYNFFWQNKFCQNLFLLSKEELLETFQYEFEGQKGGYSLPRIIISNAKERNEDLVETVKLRNENQKILFDESIEKRLTSLVKVFENILETKLKGPFENFIKYIEKKGIVGVFRIILKLSDEKNREKNVIELLQEFKFISPNINDYKSLEQHFKKSILPKKGGEVLTESNINTFFEGVKLIKDLYLTVYYKKLMETNQILVNSLSKEDDFENRIKLFHLLYESGIIGSSTEDALLECTNCKPGTFKGAIKLNIDPNKLEKLKCPVCNDNLTYFVPYTLHNDIFKIVKSKDGLLLDAYCQLLKDKRYNYSTNQCYLDDIEIDCEFYDDENYYIVESKMYKINTPVNRLHIKIKQDLRNLIKKCKRLEKLEKFSNKTIKPILLVNIIDNDILVECENIFKDNHTDTLSQNARILNFNMILNK